MKLIGIGAAGNKAVVDCVKSGSINIEDIMLINSTHKDVDDNFDQYLIDIGKNRGGCGKERSLGYKLAFNSLQKELGEAIDTFITDDDDIVGIVTSSEGGTGSGSTPIIAKYLYEEIGLNVHIFIFTGFEEDVRGIGNTIDLFKELNDKFTVHIIRNSTFIEDDNSSSYVKAEELANIHFIEMYNILTGKTINKSFQNIDDTDLFKVVNTPGYSVVLNIKLNRTTEPEDIDNIIKRNLMKLNTFKNDNLKCKCIGTIIGLKDPTMNIDRKFNIIKNTFGIPYESFIHIQETNPDNQFLTFIISGMDMPENEIKEIYNRYSTIVENVKRNKDTFFDKNSEFETINESFDFVPNERRNRRKSSGNSNSFFSSEPSKKIVQNKPSVVESPTDEDY